MYYNDGHKQTVENRGYEYIGSYRCNEETIDNRNKDRKHSFIRVKCSYCNEEYDISFQRFKKGANCSFCCNKYENSFAYYIQQELKEPLNRYWDWNKNTLNPYLIYKSCGENIWIKCKNKDYHKSYKVVCKSFYKGHRCPYCSHNKVHPKDSFAQWGIDNIDKDFLTKYWSSKNTLDPWKLAPQSTEKVWILCQNKEYHNDNGGYKVQCLNFYAGRRCGYCVNHNGMIHLKDSFGYLYPQNAKYWSKSNSKSPFEVAPKSGKEYKFYCEDCGEEFKTTLDRIVTSGRSMKCRNCTSSKGEQKIKEYLMKNNINFIPQKTFNGLKGVGNNLLSYDFYLPKDNLLIEYQGEQHEKYHKYFHRTKRDFLIQNEHDKRKREYSKDNNIKLLEIWYYDYENIEKILDNNIKI